MSWMHSITFINLSISLASLSISFTLDKSPSTSRLFASTFIFIQGLLLEVNVYDYIKLLDILMFPLVVLLDISYYG